MNQKLSPSGYTVEELQAIANGIEVVPSRTATSDPSRVAPRWTEQELRRMIDEGERARQTFSGPAVDYTGLEPPPGIEHRAPAGVRPEFALVPTQRAAGEPGRAAFEAVGGILGTAAAMPPAVAGAPPTLGATMALPVAGGALGTTMGAYAYDLYRDAARALGIRDDTVPPTASERLLGPLGSGTTDAIFGSAVAGLPALGAATRAGWRKLLKIGSEERDIANDALARGFKIGAADVKFNEGPAHIYINTIGRMPFLGGPARKAREAKLESWQQQWDSALGLFGPSIDTPQLSQQVRSRAEGAFKAFRNEAQVMYDEARRLAAQAGPVIPSDEVVQAALKATNELVTPRPLLKSGQQMTLQTPDYVLKFLDEVAELPDKLTVGNLDWLKAQLDVVMEKAKKDGFQFTQAREVLKAAEQALRSIPNEPAIQALSAADSFFHRGMQTFETATAQRFGRVDKTLFKLGHSEPGKLNEDELYRVVLNARSPQAIQDLERLVGKPTMALLARRYIDDAVKMGQREDKTGTQVFDVGALERAFKLNDPKSSEYQGLSRLLATGGVDMRDFKRLLDITRMTFGNEIPDVSTFVARSATLRHGLGTSAAVGTAGVGAAAGAALSPILAGPGGILGVLVLRHGTKLLSSPKTLRNLLQTYDSKLPESQKRMALLRIAQGLSGEATSYEREEALGLRPPRKESFNLGDLTALSPVVK